MAAAGGGIEVTATTLSGAGSLWARGGQGNTNGGGGGGGRILVTGPGPSYSLDASGGTSQTGTAHGSAGSATRN